VSFRRSVREYPAHVKGAHRHLATDATDATPSGYEAMVVWACGRAEDVATPAQRSVAPQPLTLSGQSPYRPGRDRRRFLLRELGRVEGRDLVVDVRGAEGRTDRLPALVAELLAAKPDIIVAVAPQPARAAKDATSTIPIVFVGVADPIALPPDRSAAAAIRPSDAAPRPPRAAGAGRPVRRPTRTRSKRARSPAARLRTMSSPHPSY